VTITCRASTHSAGTPALSSERPRDGRRGSLPWHYHVEHARRDLAQNGKRADEVEELFELRVDLSGERLPFGAGRELARGRAARTISIRRLMAAASATEVPPNF
jgi:hypothetical protein